MSNSPTPRTERTDGPKRQLGYIHALRGVAILMIVAVHTNSFAAQSSWPEYVYRAFLREGTSLFILISGFLFQHLHHAYTAKGFWRAKLRNVALPYVIMSIPGIVLYVGLATSHSRIDLTALHQQPVLYQIGYFLLSGATLLPYWFIPVLLMIFACYPLLRYLADSSALKYVAVVCLLSLAFTQRADSNLDPLVGFVHFAPVYVLGMALCRYWNRWIDLADRGFWALVLAGVVATGFAVVFRNPYAYSSIAIVAKLAIFMAVCARLHHVDFVTLASRSIWLRLCNYLAALSFGIYFVHGYIAALVTRTPIAFSIHNNVLAVIMGICNALLITALSVLAVEIVRRVTGRYSRMIIGA